ncbi:MAG: hypothetical protein ABL957_04690 [Parvularculaceae bacterium]
MDQGDYFAEGLDDRGGRGRIVTVGWTVRAQKAGALWAAPKPFEPHQGKPASSKSVQYCPAAVDFDRRHYVIPFPMDLTLKFERQANGQLSLIDADGAQSGVRQGALRDLMVLHPQAEWRHPERPIMQMIAPYIFVADEPCYVVQTPPYLHYFPTPRPGVQVCGRFPVHVWPRPLSWGFEWHDMAKPMTFKRGEPWFYVHFETENPAGRVRLVEQEPSEELDAYVNSIVDVSNYVNKTFSLFSEAKARRPATLVNPKKG